MARIPKAALLAAVAVLATTLSTSDAFTSTPSLKPRTATLGRANHFAPSSIQPSKQTCSGRQSTTTLHALGQEGFLGVGAPEIAVTLLVGYFVLGPSDLYKLVKEIGKFIQNFRTLGAETAAAFEGTMEDQLELTELRKAQAELSDAFSFRRSINTDETNAAFDKTSFEDNVANAAGATAANAGAATGNFTATASDGSTMEVEEGSVAPKRKKRLVRRKKKKAVEEIDVPSEDDFPLPGEMTDIDSQIKEGVKDYASEYPDLDMLDADLPGADSSSDDVSGASSDEEKLRAERLKRLTGGGGGSDAEESEPDWFTASEEDIASEVLNGQPAKDPALEAFENNRFKSQISPEDWNAQIMANEDKLSPLSMVMQRLAILEDEKNAADKRIEEEYEKRMDNEDKYYLEKRKVLEGAIGDIQEEVYGLGKEEEEVESGASKFSA